MVLREIGDRRPGLHAALPAALDGADVAERSRVVPTTSITGSPGGPTRCSATPPGSVRVVQAQTHRAEQLLPHPPRRQLRPSIAPGPLARKPHLLFVGDLVEPRKRFDRILAIFPGSWSDGPR